MPWTPSNLVVKGVEASFHQAMESAPTIWQNHCMTLPATTEVMPYAFPGFVPAPRQFISGRQFQSILDFTFNVTNQEYELSFSIPRKYYEDDQTGLINARINEAAEVWATFKDYLFCQMLVNGGTSGYTGWDGTTFYSTSRTIGSSGTIDNDDTSVAAAGDATPTTTELLDAMTAVIVKLQTFLDDTGRPFNAVASQRLRAIGNPTFRRAFTESTSQTTIATTAPIATTPTYGATTADNAWGRGLFDWDVSPYLTVGSTTQLMYVNAVGSQRMPFIYQPRTPLEIVVNTSAEDVAKNNAIEVYCRERFVFAYGEPRRSLRYTFTT